MSANLTTLASFDGIDGADPYAALLIDTNGDLFGTTSGDGTDNRGTVYEIANNGAYADTPSVLATFDGTAGRTPLGGLVADANGDLFGTTLTGGTDNDGTVFELSRTPSGYEDTPTILVSFTDTDGADPIAGLAIDGDGDLFGTTLTGGSGSAGAVFELPNLGSSAGYATAPTTLYDFTGPDGAYPESNLVLDGKGDLFGTTSGDSVDNAGTVYEITASASGYSSTLTTLATFTGATAADPVAGLLLDANGDLFGTTSNGGTSNGGTVFEISDTGGAYATAPTILANFAGADGAYPYGGLIEDTNGDLFGTTAGDDTDNYGTVYELADNNGVYAAAPTVLASFDGTDNSSPLDTLNFNASGDLFGTTAAGGADKYGTVFELAPACYLRGTGIATPTGEVPVEHLAIGDLVRTASGAVRPVKWVGRRAYAGRFLRSNPRAFPICFAAGSLGLGLPRRDLRVSPAHAMLLDGVLVPASCLTNGTTITQEHDWTEIEYHHVELDSHDLILAEGAASETFLDDGSRGVFHNAADYVALYPGEAAEGEFCAPRVESGYRLAAIRARLADVARPAAAA